MAAKAELIGPIDVDDALHPATAAATSDAHSIRKNTTS
jgi:hypothetical protein